MIRDTTSSEGLLAHVAATLAAALRYAKARLTLAGIEAREIGTHYGLAAAMIAAALFIAVLGYILVVITLVFAIAAAFDNERAWLWVMGSVAFLHLAGAAALVWLASRRLRESAFVKTLDELQKDQQWVTQLTKKP